MSAISDLLRRSRAAHLALKASSPRMEAAGAHVTEVAGDFTAMRQALSEALTTRQQAHDLDPSHLDTSWREDLVSHADLMQFYTAALGAMPA